MVLFDWELFIPAQCLSNINASLVDKNKNCSRYETKSMFPGILLEVKERKGSLKKCQTSHMQANKMTEANKMTGAYCEHMELYVQSAWMNTLVYCPLKPNRNTKCVRVCMCLCVCACVCACISFVFRHMWREKWEKAGYQKSC